jgi:hypothetical protein
VGRAAVAEIAPAMAKMAVFARISFILSSRESPNNFSPIIYI